MSHSTRYFGRRWGVLVIVVCAAAAFGQTVQGGGPPRPVPAQSGAVQRDHLGRVIDPSQPAPDRVALMESRGPKIVAKLTGSTEAAVTLAFSPDGKRLVSGGGDNTVHMWSIATAKELWHVKASGLVLGVAFSPDGKSIVYSVDPGQVITADASNGEINDVFKQPCTPGDLAFLPDSKRVICPCSDSLRIYSPNTAEAQVIQSDFSISMMAVSPKGLVAVVREKSAEFVVMEADSGKQIATHSRPLAVIPVGGTADKNYVYDVHFMGEDAYVTDATGVWKWTREGDAVSFVLPEMDYRAVPVLNGSAVVTIKDRDISLYTSDYGHDAAFQSELAIGPVAWNGAAKLLAVSCGGKLNADATFVSSGPRPIRVYAIDSLLQKAMAAKPGDSYKQRFEMPKDPQAWD